MKNTEQMNRVVAIILAVSLVVGGVGCAHSKKTPHAIPPPAKARIEALIDSALQLREAKAEFVPYELFKQAVLVSIDIWETYAVCVVDREELSKLASVDQEEAAAKLAAAEADRDRAKHDRWIWGSVGLAVGLLLGGLGIALAF